MYSWIQHVRIDTVVGQSKIDRAVVVSCLLIVRGGYRGLIHQVFGGGP